MTQNEIIEQILSLKQECGSIIDAIVHVCERNNIEIEVISSYIKYSKEMKEMVKEEATLLKMLK